jgi:hypothetical protein
MAELGVEPRLVAEAFEKERIRRQLVAQHLDRDFAPQHHIDALEDLAGATGAQALGDQVGADAAAQDRRRCVVLRCVAGAVFCSSDLEVRGPVGQAHHIAP